MHVTITFDGSSYVLLTRIVEALETIARNTAPSPFAVAFQIAPAQPAQENMNMKAGSIVKLSSKRGEAVKLAAAAPTQLSDSSPQAIAVFGIDSAGVYGAPLAPGATIVMSMGASASEAGVPGSFVQDPTPKAFNFTDPTGKVWTNIQAVASGVFTPSPAGSADVNDPFPIGYVITGGSGDSGSAQFETAVGVETSEVIGLPTT
jgi:hypothetical protein